MVAIVHIMNYRKSLLLHHPDLTFLQMFPQESVLNCQTLFAHL